MIFLVTVMPDKSTLTEDCAPANTALASAGGNCSMGFPLPELSTFKKVFTWLSICGSCPAQ
jgi:hypothetical protein